MTQDTELKKNKDIWYDKGPLLSHNALLYFALGARGTGKTFAFKSWAIKKNSQTVWVRRNQEDIDDLLGKGKNRGMKFLTDLVQEGVISPDDLTDIKFEDDTMFIGDLAKIFFIPLSLSERKKSQSYAGVNEIVFDEVFKGVGRTSYLPNEVSMFFELYETINRLRVGSGRPECRAIFIANKTSWVNPYFREFGITPFTERFKTFKDGLIVVENYQNEAFSKLKKQTKFGRLIEGTTYGKYAIDNEVWLDNDALLEDKPTGAIERSCLRYKDKYFGLWIKNGIVYVNWANNHEKRTVFAPRYDCKDNERPLVKSYYPMKDIIELFNQNRLRFEDNILKDIIFTLIQNGGKE